MTVQSKALQMQHDNDPRQEILDAVAADIAQIELVGRDLLLIVYERPDKLKEIKKNDGTTGLLYLPETSRAREEDKFQGIVGLVVKIGPCVGEASDRFKDGKLPQVGDWVIAPIASCLSMLIGKRTARFIEPQMLRGIIQRPDMVA